MPRSSFFPVLIVLLGFAGAVDSAHGAIATGVTGLYYTGESSSGGELTAGTALTNNSGTQDPYWTVTYASTNGGVTAATPNEGTSYVINTTQTTYATQYPSPPWAPNTTNAEWITAPGAVFTNGTGVANMAENAGGDGLLGYGSDSSPVAMNASNAAIYVYTTTFTITGNGTAGTAVTGFTLNLQVSADNNFDIFVNPASTTTALGVGTAAYVSGANAYTAASAIALTSGFVIGVNTISIQVENAAAAGSSSINYSGLLVYGGSVALPEVGAWLPLVAAMTLYGAWRGRRSFTHRLAAAAGAVVRPEVAACLGRDFLRRIFKLSPL